MHIRQDRHEYGYVNKMFFFFFFLKYKDIYMKNELEFDSLIAITNNKKI